ncbi:hypothetical protein E1212_02405 [Jiangella ureilytica]|uniref:Prenyltransferase n=1 Tax=Jiangella ureilytica TaxID=2530374 RepID=A0A4R4RXV5_9ACTN|nr:hypothetical protein [Jiangella ureilytica]TDC54614.1 hypothetical protein E1212_02405 [Jiangella ureilytica]
MPLNRTWTDPAVARLAGDTGADAMTSPRVRALLAFPSGVHPYAKWHGAHWRLVELADLGVTPPPRELERAVNSVLDWLTGPGHDAAVVRFRGRYRVHASQEGNALYACSRLGLAGDSRVALLAGRLLAWQWPDGGWNCDRHPDAHRSSFHETVTPALGLAAFAAATGNGDARDAARRAAELLLEHHLFRRLDDGAVIHPSWLRLHYPPYWHYDIGQGLRLLHELGLLADPRAADAMDVLRRARRRDGRFTGPTWSSARQPPAADWGRGADNEMLNLRAETILAAADAAATTRDAR